MLVYPTFVIPLTHVNKYRFVSRSQQSLAVSQHGVYRKKGKEYRRVRVNEVDHYQWDLEIGNVAIIDKELFSEEGGEIVGEPPYPYVTNNVIIETYKIPFGHMHVSKDLGDPKRYGVHFEISSKHKYTKEMLKSVLNKLISDD